LIEQAHHCLDQAQRMEIYAQAQRILVNAVPVLTLYYSRRHILKKPWVIGNPGVDVYTFDWKEVILGSHDIPAESGSHP
jgi:ABC-type oligopeptide transport system substrate-binding subunit